MRVGEHPLNEAPAKKLADAASWGGVEIRGQLPEARVPLYVPYADFYQYQAGAGRLADRA